MEILHPRQNQKPKAFTATVERKGGRLAAECGCGWYCMHNHKSVEAAGNCIKRHADDIAKR
jgi:hypothetical protein